MEKLIKDGLDSVQKTTNEAIDARMVEINARLEKSAGETAESLKALQDELTKLSVAQKKANQRSETIDLSPMASIKAMTGTLGTIVKERATERGFDFIQKDVSPASFGGDIQSLISAPAEFDQKPYAPVYLRTLFPNVATNKGYLPVWKRDAVTGAAAVWNRTVTEGATAPKARVKPTWEKTGVEVKWIAGLMDVPVEILEDVDFMQSEVPHALVYGPTGVLAAENAMILSYIKNNSVDFTDDEEFSVGVEKILAAAFGQLGNNYLSPSHLLINRFDYLTYLQFNKAEGSGQYTLPNTSLQFVNGRLFVNGLEAIPTDLDKGEAYVIDASRSRFVNRKQVQLKAFEQNADNVETNLVTFRAEERVAFFTYDENSIVKVNLPSVE